MRPGVEDYVATYPGFDGPETRGVAYLGLASRKVAVVGELPDNPGRDSTDALELIASGLVEAGLVDDDFTLLHYLARDHVRGGQPALWQIKWHGEDSRGKTWFAMPEWAPLSAELAEIGESILEAIDSFEEFTVDAVDARANDGVHLLDDEDVRDSLMAVLGRNEYIWVWSDIAELAFGGGTVYVSGTGSVDQIRTLSHLSPDGWAVGVEVSLDVERPEGDLAQVMAYRVTLEALGERLTQAEDVSLID